MSAAVDTRTDMGAFEGAHDDVCHSMNERDEYTSCGLPAAALDGEPFHDGRYIDGVCSGCGRPACPPCLSSESWAR